MRHLSYPELEAGLGDVRRAPKDEGTVELIVVRPAEDERDVLESGELDLTEGLVGDTWSERGSTRTDDGSAQPDKQLTLMGSRAAALIAGGTERWALAGDQLFLDLDLSYENVPPGTRLVMGSAVVEVTPALHRGCAKFAARFGRDALRFVNSDVGAELNLRGVNAKVVASGTVRRGDIVRKVAP